MQFIDDYIDGMKNPSHVQYPHPLYKDSAEETFGILVYQEQIMQVVQDMAGFSLGEADVLRRGIGKKQKEYIDNMRVEFTDRCVKRGIPEDTATSVYDMIEKFASYGFNKSHSDCYARIAYETAYLKAHYPECFMCANLTINADDKKKLLTTLMECRNMNIKILPPSIQKSSAIFKVEPYSIQIKNGLKRKKLGIRYGLAGIDRIGMDMAEGIECNNSPTLFDFVNDNPQVRKNQLENLIFAGALDEFGSRREMVEMLPSMRDFIKRKQLINSIYGSSILDKVIGEDSYDGFEYSLMDKMNREKNVINISLSGHTLDYVRPLDVKYQQCDKIPHLLSMKNGDEVYILAMIGNIKTIMTKKNKPMAFVTLEDEFMDIEGIVFPTAYEAISHLLEEGSPLMITGTLSVENVGEVDEKRVIFVNSVEKVLDKELRLYIPQEILQNTHVLEQMKNRNGICSVIAVDTHNLAHLAVEKIPLYVDISEATRILEENNIRYIIK